MGNVRDVGPANRANKLRHSSVPETKNLTMRAASAHALSIVIIRALRLPDLLEFDGNVRVLAYAA